MRLSGCGDAQGTVSFPRLENLRKLDSEEVNLNRYMVHWITSTMPILVDLEINAASQLLGVTATDGWAPRVLAERYKARLETLGLNGHCLMPFIKDAVTLDLPRLTFVSVSGPSLVKHLNYSTVSLLFQAVLTACVDEVAARRCACPCA